MGMLFYFPIHFTVQLIVVLPLFFDELFLSFRIDFEHIPIGQLLQLLGAFEGLGFERNALQFILLFLDLVFSLLVCIILLFCKIVLISVLSGSFRLVLQCLLYLGVVRL